MSLEEKFASLSMDDVSSIVDSVKADGVLKSGLVDSIVSLTARCASKDDNEALAGMKVVKELAEQVPTSQPFIKDCLGACKYLSNVSVIDDCVFSWSMFELSILILRRNMEKISVTNKYPSAS